MSAVQLKRKDLLFDTAFDPCQFLLDSPFKPNDKKMSHNFHAVYKFFFTVQPNAFNIHTNVKTCQTVEARKNGQGVLI